MQVKIFTIPIYDGGERTEEMNRFLRGHKILEVQEHFQPMAQGGAWCFCIKYLGKLEVALSYNKKVTQGRVKVDYKKELNAVAFKAFSLLRKARKAVADENGLPAFAVFTDAELSAIAKLENKTPSEIKKISGIGVKKLERFVPKVLALYEKYKTDEASKTPTS